MELKMKFKYEFNSDTLLLSLKNNGDLFWNGDSIFLNEVSILEIHSVFENHAKNLDDTDNILSSKSVDYSTYESRLYFYLSVNFKNEYLFSLWKNEFESLSSSSIFDIIFEKADEKIFMLLESINSLKA